MAELQLKFKEASKYHNNQGLHDKLKRELITNANETGKENRLLKAENSRLREEIHRLM
jgi:hypothetical protein